MLIKIVCVGRGGDNFTPLIDDYVKRLNRVVKAEFIQISPSGKSGVAARHDESSRMLGKIKPSALVWLLDETGEQLSSLALASRLNVAQCQAVQELVVCIGGAYGVSDAMFGRANFVLSLSNMVFPHRLAQLVIVEQLYRATEINRGGGYHHA